MQHLDHLQRLLLHGYYQFIDATVIVEVRDGRLSVQIGGTENWTMLNLLEVMELPGTPSR